MDVSWAMIRLNRYKTSALVSPSEKDALQDLEGWVSSECLPSIPVYPFAHASLPEIIRGIYPLAPISLLDIKHLKDRCLFSYCHAQGPRMGWHRIHAQLVLRK